jgi:Ca2+-binding RTX toxin-like protein
MRGQLGKDTLYGNDGNDSLFGGDGNDTLSGGAGNDTLDGGAGDDTLDGGAGDDVYEYWGHQGFDVISETSGFDKIIFKDGHQDNAGWGSPFREGNDLVYIAQNELSGFRVQDHFLNPKNSIEQFEYEVSGYSVLVRNSDTPIESDTSSELLVGTSQDDTLIGTDSAVGPHTEFYAYDGDDVIDNSNGTKSWIEAGAGDDTLIGGNAEDRMRGQLGKDTLYGNDGNDSLFGGDGNDTLSGGAGNDTLNGGAGNDTIVYAKGDGNDTIIDFVAGTDTLEYQDFTDQEKSSFVESITDSGDTLITLSDGATITLKKPTQDIGILFGSEADTKTSVPDQTLVFKSGTDTTLSLSSGKLESLSEDFIFTHVEFASQSYDHGIAISDVVLQLRDIVGLSTLSGNQKTAADIDGDGDVAIGDVVSNLRHIVGLDTIEQCALVDSSDQLVTNLTTSTMADLTLIQLGDVDLSATFVEIL